MNEQLTLTLPEIGKKFFLKEDVNLCDILQYSKYSNNVRYNPPKGSYCVFAYNGAVPTYVSVVNETTFESYQIKEQTLSQTTTWKNAISLIANFVNNNRNMFPPLIIPKRTIFKLKEIKLTKNKKPNLVEFQLNFPKETLSLPFDLIPYFSLVEIDSKIGTKS